MVARYGNEWAIMTNGMCVIFENESDLQSEIF